MEQVIHLRHNLKEKKYQLTVPLSTVFKNVEINQEVEVECSEVDSVGFLLEKAKSEIKNVIFRKLRENGNESRIENDDVDVYLRRKRQESYKIIPENLEMSNIINQDHNKTKITLFDKEFKIMVNAPKITVLKLPPVIYATYTVRPIKFEGLYTKSEFCKFKWFKSKDKTEWTEMKTGFGLPVGIEDIGYFLKLTCIPRSSDNIEGPRFDVVSKGVVLEFPKIPVCPFNARHSYTKNACSGRSYRFVCYNTLSSRYTHHDDAYSYCKDEFLVIDYRKELILKEIVGYNADILCLQEVDSIEYHGFFKRELEAVGYLTKFYCKGFYLPEGMMCAIRKSRFSLKSYEQIVFCNALKVKPIFADLYDLMQKDRKFMQEFAIQSPSMQIFEIKCKDKRIILLGNVHLSHYSGNDDNRRIHSFMAIRYLKFMKDRLQSVNKQLLVDIVLCGDFNSTPDSEVYRFISNGSVPLENCIDVARHRVFLKHMVKLKSACGTPKFTSYSPTFKNCIDYIFIEEANAEIEQVVPFLEEEIEKLPGLPNEFYPSDHLALVVDIKFKD